MRLDVDNMTYEACISVECLWLISAAFLSVYIWLDSFSLHILQELVALQEQIGDVNTGLTESYIQENLRSTFHVPGAASISDQFCELSLENDACIICQVNFLPCSDVMICYLYIINPLPVIWYILLLRIAIVKTLRTPTGIRSTSLLKTIVFDIWLRYPNICFLSLRMIWFVPCRRSMKLENL